MATTAAQAQIMESVAQKFESVNDELQGLLTNLMNQLEAMQQGWVGQSGRSFEQVKQAWADNQKKLSDSLRETATGVRSSGQQYTSTDEETSGQVGNISTQINIPL